MGELYKILDYAKGVIIQNLDEREVCAIAKALMSYPIVSFDIVRGRNFVTSDFEEFSDGSWQFKPMPVEK